MQDLLDRETDDGRAAEAIALFVTRRRSSWELWPPLSAGSTPSSSRAASASTPRPSRRVCEDLEFLGIRLDPDRNAAHAPVISSDDATVTVRVVPTDEDLMVARHTRRLIEQEH